MATPTIVYIDGFNLYYGALKNTPHKWLNLERLFTLIRPHDDILSIRYFSALITGPNRAHQDLYVRALATTPKVEVILGNFKNKKVKCIVPLCSATCERVFQLGKKSERM